MRYPFDRYIKALLLHGLSLEEVKFALKAAALVYVDKTIDSEIELVRAEIATVDRTVPMLFKGTRKKALSPTVFQRAIGTTVPWPKSVEFEDITSFMATTPLRRACQALYMKGLPAEVVIQQVEFRFQTTLDPGVMQAFFHYLWDAPSMNFQDWYVYLALAYKAQTEEEEGILLGEHIGEVSPEAMLVMDERRFFDEIMLSDIHRVLWLIGADPQLQEIDFLQRFLGNVQQKLIASVDPRINPNGKSPNDLVYCFTQMREHLLDNLSREDASVMHTYQRKLGEAAEIVDDNKEMPAMAELGEQVG